MRNKFLFLNKRDIVNLLLIRIRYFIFISKIDVFIILYSLFYCSLFLFITQSESNIFYYIIKNIMK